MQNAAVLEKQGFGQLLKIRPYLIYLSAQAITRLGDSLDSIAYSWMVYMLTGSELLMGTLFAFNFLPGLLFSLFTGTFVDRWPKKRVLALTYLSRGIVVSLTAFLYAIGSLQVWHLFVFTFLNSTLECFSRPAETSIVPRLLPKEQLLAGNSFSTSVSRSAELIGLSIAGALIALIGISGTILIDAVTFLIAAVIIAFMPNPEAAEQAEFSGPVPEKNRTVLGDIKEALLFVKQHSLLLITTVLAMINNFCLAPLNVLQPVYVKETLGAGAGGLSVMGTALLIGMVCSGLWIGRYGKSFKKSTLIMSGSIMLGIGYFALGIPGYLPAWRVESAAVCMFVAGFAVSMLNAPISTYLMEVTPRHMLGRIGALMTVLCTAAIPVGSLITGVVAEHHSPPVLFSMMGFVMLVPVLFLFRKKSFRAI
ncbi:MFS transporter, DHA3 family, macrolide efflux protein [Paenibacillus sp. cl141a]|uniref:MFS transporter n=1 Tax=Paenibacillus sp. cl141a TaxID=1761877 RepID=UPI0008B674B1|nr:MFS transporter [Paenibacillus sp. cl141a]SEK32177.1 MFS transporter, DHA3 family, macrolide efflux protein [Paenibacillus sp. cl141a]